MHGNDLKINTPRNSTQLIFVVWEKLTPTWFEHANFWSVVRRATVAPRSHLARMEDSDIADHAIQHQAELENIAQNIE